MAFQKTHANLVSSWSFRYWLLRINTVQGSVVSAECVGNSRAVLFAVWELGTVDPVRGWSSPSTAGNTAVRAFPIFFIRIMFLFITHGLYVLVHAPHKALELVPMCPIRCLVSKCSFLESSDSLGVYLCCSTLCKNLLYFNWAKCSPSLEAANMVFLFMYCAYYGSQMQRLGSCFWRRPDGSLCIWMSSVPSLSLLLPLGPWLWQKVSTDVNNGLWYAYSL